MEEDDREGLEGYVEEGVDEGDVGACGGDDGFEKEHSEGASQDLGYELGEVDGFVEVSWGDDVGGVALLAEETGSLGQENGVVGFWEEEEHDERGGGADEADPEGPAPADGW